MSAVARTFADPPSSVVDPRTGLPFEGSFRGSLPPVDLRPLGKGAIYHLTHRKRWLYVALRADDLFIGLAIVDLGYALNTFAFAWERGSQGLVVDRTAIGLPGTGSVSRSFGAGFSARFKVGGTRVAITHDGAGYELDATYPDLSIRARFAATAAHPPLSAIGRIPGGTINATEKHALLPVTGEAVVRGKHRSLDGALAGYDFTHGYLARHTQWRWGYGMGRARTGERVAFNLVQGFLGERECGVWVDDTLHPLGEGRFELDLASPLQPWRVTTLDRERAGAGLKLEFTPGGAHADSTNLGLVRARFLHPVGAYRGTLEVGDRVLELDDVLGVAEDQDVVW